MYLNTTTNIIFGSQNKTILSKKVQSKLIPSFFAISTDEKEKNMKGIKISKKTKKSNKK